MDSRFLVLPVSDSESLLVDSEMFRQCLSMEMSDLGPTLSRYCE